MLSTTTEQDSDDSLYKYRRKSRRQRVSSLSSDSDDSVVARPHRRKKCRVSSSSSDSDDSMLARPSRKKCKVLSVSESDSTASSDSEEEKNLRRRHDREPNKRTVSSNSEAPSEKGSPKTTNSATVDVNSSDSDEGEKCIICFKSLKPPFAHPSNCSHHFHPNCLATWTKTSNTCPIDRVTYTAILVVDHKGDLISRESVTTPPPQDHNADFEPDDATFCEVCSQHDREHEMLLCDRCEAGYHLDCLSPPLREVPDGNWFCPRCTDLGNELAEEMNGLMDDAAIILETRMRQRSAAMSRMPSRPRTRGAQRVFNIIHHQQTTDQPSTSSVTIRRHHTTSHRTRRSKSSRRPQSTRYKVELITVEDGTTLEVKVAVNTRTRTKSKKHSRRKSKKKCSKGTHKSGGPSTSRDAIFTGEGPSRSLDLFGNRPQLDYFSGCEAEDELDEDGGGGGGVTALRRAPRPGVRNMASRKHIAAQIMNVRPQRQAPRIEVSRAPVDLVSSIMEQQEKWHSPGASYESTSNGDIRVIMKESRSSKMRQAGGSSGGGSSGNAPSTSAQTSSSSSQPSRDAASSGSGSAGGSRDASSASRPSSLSSSRIYDDDEDLSTVAKTSGSSERVPSPKMSSPSEMDRDDKDTDEGSQCRVTSREPDSDIPSQSPLRSPSLFENKEEERNNTEGFDNIGDERSLSQLPHPAVMDNFSQQGSPDGEKQSDCPIQGIYSKISQEIAESRNDSENSDNDDETPPTDGGSFTSAADTPLDDQRVPEDLSIKKTDDDDEEKVGSDINEDKRLDLKKTNLETKNEEIECDKQDAAYEQDGHSKREDGDDKPEDLTMADDATQGIETAVEEHGNENKVTDEKESCEQDITNLGETMDSKEAIIGETTNEVGDMEEQDVSNDKYDTSLGEKESCEQDIASLCETMESKEAIIGGATKELGDMEEQDVSNEKCDSLDEKEGCEQDITSLGESMEPKEAIIGEVTNEVGDMEEQDISNEKCDTSLDEKESCEQDIVSLGDTMESKEAIIGEVTNEEGDMDERDVSNEKCDTGLQEVDERQDILEECDVKDTTSKNDVFVQETDKNLEDFDKRKDAEVANLQNDVDLREDDKVTCRDDGEETSNDTPIESEATSEIASFSNKLTGSMPRVDNDDTKNSVVEASPSELSDGEFVDEVTEEGPHNEEEPASSLPSNSSFNEPSSKDEANGGDMGYPPLCCTNDNEEINPENETLKSKPGLNESRGGHVDKTLEENSEMDSSAKISNSENEQEAQGGQGADLLEIGCEEEKDGLVDITDEEISSYERSWEMEENGEKNKKEGLEGLETEAISDCEYQPVDADVSQTKEIEESLEFQPSNKAVEDVSREEEGEIVNEDGSPVHRKKTSKEKNYRGDMKAKEKNKGSAQNNDKQPEVRRVVTEKPRKKGDFGRDISSDSGSTSLSSSIGRSISREKISRSKSRSRSRGRVKERLRDRARDRSREHSRERNKVRSISREKNRRNRDRQSRSRSRKRRRSRTPRRDKGRSRERGSRDRKKRKRSPSSSCSSCSCSSCERNKKRNKKHTVIVPNEGKARERSRDRDKNKKDKRRSRSRNRTRKTNAPSKEVFTSGNNILVSVNFKSSNAEEVARAEAAASSKRKKDDDARKKKDKRTKENQPMRSIVTKKSRKRRKLNTSNMKPVAIIDLDASPFRETTLSPKEVIILTDSDDEDKLAQTESAMQMSGPKTPPEPHIKFSIANNKQQQQLRGPNPLVDITRRDDDDDDLMHIGPNTPPEPSAPYDPFEPTKSRSPSPGPASRSDRIPSPAPDAKQRHSPLQSQISLTPPKLSQHDSPKTPSPLQSMPKDMGDLPEKNKQLPFQPAGLDSGDDSGGGGGGDSPYSPGSSEGDDLFEPPMAQSASVPKTRPRPMVPQSNKSKVPPPKVAMNTQKRSNNQVKDASKKGPVKRDMGMKLDEDQLKILDDLPNSAVEMQFLRKLNRQERVVEEVKLVLKPHFAKKHVSKEEYKEILRRSVPKICHSRSGEINPMKIQRLIEAYVKKYRHRMKRKGAAPTIPPLRQNKPVVVKTQWA